METNNLITFFIIIIFSLSFFPSANSQASFKIINKCRTTIWPGLLSGATSPPLPTTGFALKPGQSETLKFPAHWSGRIWARTDCRPDSTGKLVCLTGDCGSGKLECVGAGAKPPATLAEFTLNGADNLDFYDVSLVDGYNIPMLIVPKGGNRGGCGATGCLVDLNVACPRELGVRMAARGRSVACRSACEAFGDPRFCCSEGYNTPDTCPPSVYSEFFKHACPRSYSYAYDDKTSTFTCAGADYVIVFCPPPYTSQKVLGIRKDGAALPLVNKTMMYLASRHASSAASPGLPNVSPVLHGASIVAAISLFWPFPYPL